MSKVAKLFKLIVLQAGGGLDRSLGGNSTAASVQWTRSWTIASAAIGWIPIVTVHSLGEIAPVTILGATMNVVIMVVVVAFAVIVHPVSPTSLLSVVANLIYGPIFLLLSAEG
jgi:hypothetical protein